MRQYLEKYVDGVSVAYNTIDGAVYRSLLKEMRSNKLNVNELKECVREASEKIEDLLHILDDIEDKMYSEEF